MHADLVFFAVDEKDGKTVQRKDSGATYEFKSSGRKHSMVIKNATVHEEGEYVATVGEQECSCELTVVELPPEFVHKIQPVKVGSFNPIYNSTQSLFGFTDLLLVPFRRKLCIHAL